MLYLKTIIYIYTKLGNVFFTRRKFKRDSLYPLRKYLNTIKIVSTTVTLFENTFNWMYDFSFWFTRYPYYSVTRHDRLRWNTNEHWFGIRRCFLKVRISVYVGNPRQLFLPTHLDSIVRKEFHISQTSTFLVKMF